MAKTEAQIRAELVVTCCKQSFAVSQIFILKQDNVKLNWRGPRKHKMRNGLMAALRLSAMPVWFSKKPFEV